MDGCRDEQIFFRPNRVVPRFITDFCGFLAEPGPHSDAIVDGLLLAVVGCDWGLGLVSLEGRSGWFSANSGFTDVFWPWSFVVGGGGVA